MEEQKDGFVKVLKKRHTNLIFGFDGHVYDRHLLGYISYEVGVLCKSDFQIKKIDQFWIINAEKDWVKFFTSIDQDYLFKALYLSYFEHASGVVLAAFSNGVCMALSGKITISYNLTEKDLKFIQIQISNHTGRTLIFKTIEEDREYINHII